MRAEDVQDIAKVLISHIFPQTASQSLPPQPKSCQGVFANHESHNEAAIGPSIAILTQLPIHLGGKNGPSENLSQICFLGKYDRQMPCFNPFYYAQFSFFYNIVFLTFSGNIEMELWAKMC